MRPYIEITLKTAITLVATYCAFGAAASFYHWDTSLFLISEWYPSWRGFLGALLVVEAATGAYAMTGIIYWRREKDGERHPYKRIDADAQGKVWACCPERHMEPRLVSVGEVLMNRDWYWAASGVMAPRPPKVQEDV